MELGKKDKIIIILSLGLLISGGINLFNSMRLSLFYIPSIPLPEPQILIYGTGSGPADLDPCDAWDSASNDVIRQVAEPLFFYNLSDPDLPRLNWLCESYSWINAVSLEINIRTGIKFHDGTDMDAAACAWNIDRLIRLMNHTGEMPASLTRAKIHSLYEFPDGSPVFSRTEVINSDSFRIILNGPYSQILAAMAYVSCSILSPTSTPADRFLDKADVDDLLIGTGPYVYEYYIADTEVRFHRWEEYWGTPADTGSAFFEELVFDVIDNPAMRSYSILAGKTDYNSGSITDLFDEFEASPHVTFYEHPNPGLGISYMGMNNDIFTIADGDMDDAANGLNSTWRKAISYAFNYSYIVHEYWQDQMARAYSFISPGYGSYFDPELEKLAPYCNYTIARQTIIDDMAGVNSVVASLPNTPPGTVSNQRSDDAAWENVTLISFNYSYNTDNRYRSDLYPLLKDWLGKIGVHVIDAGTDWSYWWVRPPSWYFTYNALQLYWVGWGPDYLDPMNMIQPLISNLSSSNSAQVNDPWIEFMIAKYNTDVSLTEEERVEIIHNLSRYLVTELYPHVYGYHAKIYSVHAADLYDVPYNVVGNWWAYPIKRNLTWIPN